MAPIPKGGTVAVTGSAGFIGGWMVRLLLDRGYRVRACVRDVEDANKTSFLKDMPGYASGRLTLHAADLDQPGCLDDIFTGCNGVTHLSHVSGYDDQAYIRRVCDHIIASVNKSETATRIVVTSSVAAVLSEVDMQELVRRPVCNEDRYPDERNPERTPEHGQGYSMAKVLADRAFAERLTAREAEFRAIWAGCELRNDRIRAVTDVEFRPLDVSIRDCVEPLIAVAKVQPKRRV